MFKWRHLRRQSVAALGAATAVRIRAPTGPTARTSFICEIIFRDTAALVAASAEEEAAAAVAQRPIEQQMHEQ